MNNTSEKQFYLDLENLFREDIKSILHINLKNDKEKYLNKIKSDYPNYLKEKILLPFIENSINTTVEKLKNEENEITFTNYHEKKSFESYKKGCIEGAKSNINTLMSVLSTEAQTKCLKLMKALC